MWTDQVPNPIHCFHGGIVEIVDDGNAESLFEKLNHCVGSDESSTAGHENRLLRPLHSPKTSSESEIETEMTRLEDK